MKTHEPKTINIKSNTIYKVTIIILLLMIFLTNIIFFLLDREKILEQGIEQGEQQAFRRIEKTIRQKGNVTLIDELDYKVTLFPNKPFRQIVGEARTTNFIGTEEKIK